MAWKEPKTDWNTNPKSPMPVDFNRIEENIEYLLGEIETKKGAIVDAVNSMNQTATIENSYGELSQKIKDISKDATATVSDIRTGKTAYVGGQKVVGDITGIEAQTYTPSTVNQIIPKNMYLKGNQTILGDPDLVSNNIKSGVNLFGVAGAPNILDTTRIEAGSNVIFSDPTERNSYLSPSNISHEFKIGKLNRKGSIRVSVDVRIASGDGVNIFFDANGKSVISDATSSAYVTRVVDITDMVSTGGDFKIYFNRKDTYLGETKVYYKNVKVSIKEPPIKPYIE